MPQLVSQAYRYSWLVWNTSETCIFHTTNCRFHSSATTGYLYSTTTDYHAGVIGSCDLMCLYGDLIGYGHRE